MSRICEYCGKHTQFGNRKTTRGKAKYLGGVGTKITGLARRTFQPNLRRIRAQIGGTVRRVVVCTRCLSAGMVNKRVVRTPPISS